MAFLRSTSLLTGTLRVLSRGSSHVSPLPPRRIGAVMSRRVARCGYAAMPVEGQMKVGFPLDTTCEIILTCLL